MPPLLTPVAFAVSFELARLDVSGPMVDGIETSFYGLIAFITGRGFHAVLSLVWLVLGAFLGAGLARYLRTSRVFRHAALGGLEVVVHVRDAGRAVPLLT